MKIEITKEQKEKIDRELKRQKHYLEQIETLKNKLEDKSLERDDRIALRETLNTYLHLLRCEKTHNVDKQNCCEWS